MFAWGGGKAAGRLASVLLIPALCLLALHADWPPATAGAELRGDADCSGAVDPQDMRAVLASSSGLAPAGCVAILGDADCDGSVLPLDALRIAYHLAGILSGQGNCVVGGPLAPGPSSFELIDAAVQGGQISTETGILYKAYAALGDSRLPLQFRGSGGNPEPPEEIWLRPVGLTAEATSILDTFLLPPPAPGSWYQIAGLGSPGFGAAVAHPAGATATPPPGEWQKVQPASARLNIWWDAARPGDQAKANVLAADADMLWDKYQALLGVQPLEDSQPPHHGPDSKYDIYLSPLGAGFFGYVSAYASQPAGTQGCQPRPSFMVINNSSPNVKLRGTLAHEMFHVFQNSRSFDSSCKDVLWLLEAAAAWAEDYAFPSLNTEHSLYGYPENHEEEIKKWYAGGYGAYIYLWHLTRTSSDQPIADLFDALETNSPLDALNQISDGGLDARFPEFARYAWNSAPGDYFQQWDGISAVPLARDLQSKFPKLSQGAELVLNDGEEERAFSASESEVGPLSVDYYRFSFSAFSAGKVDPKYVRINNPFASLPQYGSVQVGHRIAGQATWTFEDISSAQYTDFCLTIPEELVDEVVIIVANADTQGRSLPAFTQPLVIERDHCPSWSGTTSFVRTDFCDVSCDVGGSGGSITYTGTATELVFEPRTPPAGGIPGDYFRLKSGKMNVSINGQVDTCQFSGNGTVDIPAGAGLLRVTEAQNGVTYALYGYTEVVTPFITNCGGGPSNGTRQVGIWLCSGGQKTSANPQSLTGNYFFQGPGTSFPGCQVSSLSDGIIQPAGASGNQRTYSWNLTR